MTDESYSSSEAVRTPRPKASWALIVLATITFVASLYFMRDILIPIVFALLLALLFRPVQRRMKKWRIPNGVSAAILVAAVAGVFCLVLWGLAGQAQQWLAEAPNIVRRVQEMLPTTSGPVADLNETSKAVDELRNGVDGPPPSEQDQASSETPPADEVAPAAAWPAGAADWAMTAAGVSSYAIGATVIAFVLFYFLLALSDQLICQAVEAMPTFDDKRSVVQVLGSVEQGISNYLGTITVINIGLGVVTGTAMWLMALPNPVLWGAMTTTLNFVPHVGAFICMVVLFIVGAVTHQSLGWGIATAGVFVFFTSAESYFLTPMVLSKRLQLSPLAVILAILFWGWLWGVGGGLMAAPLLTITKIVCDQFPSLQPIAVILGGEPASAHNPTECDIPKQETKKEPPAQAA